MMMLVVDEILSFWFGEPAQDEAELLAKFKRWFRGGPELDAEIARRFGAVHERAATRELDSWAETPRGRLALVIVLDQFSRNIHRDTARAFACDGAACRLAIEAVMRRLDAGMSLEERLFLVMPLEHAEDPKMQDAAVAYVRRIAAEAPAQLANAWQIAVASAREHQATIAKFGRFPQRNLAIGRTTTGLELTFLADMEQRKSRGSQ
jgi:uncharacterized protein (DUF924 family)